MKEQPFIDSFQGFAHLDDLLMYYIGNKDTGWTWPFIQKHLRKERRLVAGLYGGHGAVANEDKQCVPPAEGPQIGMWVIVCMAVQPHSPLMNGIPH